MSVKSLTPAGVGLLSLWSAAVGVADAGSVEPALTRPHGRPSLSLVSRNQVMSGFTREIKINAPVEQVWEALGDIGQVEGDATILLHTLDGRSSGTAVSPAC